MAYELKHKDAGIQLTYAEYHNTDTHEADGQTEGDVFWFNGTSWVRIPLTELCEDYASELIESIGIDDYVSAAITTHEGDTDPHGDRVYTDAEIVGHAALDTGVHGAGEDTLATDADIDADIATHAADDDAHHSRYTDAEAITAAKTVKLDDFASPDDNTDLNTSESAHGLCPKLDGNADNALRGDGTWGEVSGEVPPKDTAFPSAASEGDLIYRTDLDKLFVCDQTYDAAATIEKSVAAQDDDAYVYTDDSSIDLSETYMQVGTGTATKYYHAGMRFLGITIPDGATITAAYLKLIAARTDAYSTTIKIQGEQNNAAAAFSTYADFMGRSLTTEFVNWVTGNVTLGTEYETEDIAAIIQELLDDYSGLSDDEIVIFLRSSGVAVNHKRFASYDNVSYTEPILHIEYVAATESYWKEVPREDNVLTLDNTTEFTPDADYEPATKKYVDDNAGGGDEITDADNDTKIQVEESTDEDIIRMDVAGVETFNINSVGILTLAKQASCKVYQENGTDQYYPGGAWYKVMFNTEDSDVQNEFDSTVKTGVADATEANKLHDADGGFSASDVGAVVWNTTDNTYATVTEYVDSGELTLDTDIMVNGEGYNLYHSTYTATEDGIYLVVFGQKTAGSLNDQESLQMKILKNGSNNTQMDLRASDIGQVGNIIPALINMSIDDYLEFQVKHDNAGDIKFADDINYSFAGVIKIA